MAAARAAAWACLVGAAGVVGSTGTRGEREVSALDFLERLKSLGAEQRAVVFDVGANKGSWSRWIGGACTAAGRACEQVIVEPQAQFHAGLQHIVAGGHRRSELFRAIASHKRGNRTLYLGHNSEAVSTLRVMASIDSPKSAPRAVTVPTIDLPQLMHDRMEGAALAFLKLDVEAAECAAGQTTAHRRSGLTARRALLSAGTSSCRGC